MTKPGTVVVSNDADILPKTWPAAFTIAAIAFAAAFGIWGLVRSDEARYEAETQQYKQRLEHEKWLIENGHK